MNTVDKKILDYLERAEEIAIKVEISNWNSLYESKIIEIAKLLQTEELNQSNMKVFKDKK